MHSDQKPHTLPISVISSSSIRIVLGAVLLSMAVVLYRKLNSKPTPLQQVYTQYQGDIAQLDSLVRQLQLAVLTKRPVSEWQASFRQARLRYKRVEFLAELYHPETAKSINGPNLAEVDETDRKVEQPEGLQVLEELLFPYESGQYQELNKQLAVLVSNVGRLRKVTVNDQLTDSHVFDAVRLELFRLITLGITGFDSPVIHHSLPEAVEVLASLQRHVSFYELPETAPVLATRLDEAFTRSRIALKQAPDFDRFDRLTFITNQAYLLSSLLLDVQHALAIPVFRERRFLASDARTLSDSNAFDASFFVKSTDDQPTTARIALGKRLFFDPVLSGDGKRTCANCHQPSRSFTDGEPSSMAMGVSNKRINRNAPTLLNASLQAVQFMDSRAVYLEDQASDVIANQTEMHGSLKAAVIALTKQADYRESFTRAYKEGLSENTIKNALASYVRSLTSLDSRLDQYLRKQSAQLTNEEKLGFNLFMGKAQCATCHFFPLFNGTVPPAFAKTESEVLGTPATAANRVPDEDMGKFTITTMVPHKRAFKTPSVRHAEQTAPYMHNGVYVTLEQVVDFYNKGGGNGLGFRLPNQTLSAAPLQLSKSEQKALIAFLKAL